MENVSLKYSFGIIQIVWCSKANLNVIKIFARNQKILPWRRMKIQKINYYILFKFRQLGSNGPSRL
jgi:hypothetical protein